MEETDDIFSLVLLFLPQQEKPFDRDDDAVFPEKRKPMLNQLSAVAELEKISWAGQAKRNTRIRC
jgi:hypothetical protein